MKILAIESSCDETSAAVVIKDNTHPLANNSDIESIQILSNIVSSSVLLHAKTGGVIPEQAAREQVKLILPVIEDALIKAFPVKKSQQILQTEIDAIAVTVGPGLIGSLLVGVETAKTLAYVFKKPLIPVNHLLAHLYANFIDNPSITFPFIGLIVSGGHTDLLYFKNHDDFTWLGGTRDDAAGEALDKIGRILGLPYPAGPEIDKRAQNIEKTEIRFKSPLLHEDTLDFSFSGLKTEVMRFVQQYESLTDQQINEICFATQKAIVDVLVDKAFKAAQKYNAPTVIVGGGVSANSELRKQFQLSAKRSTLNASVRFPEPKYSTDNAAVIGTYAAFHPEPTSLFDIKARPDLYFD